MSPTNTYIIAEAGVNHNGQFDMAVSLIEKAKAAGADAVKFQTFKAEKVMSVKAPKAEYQISNTGISDETQLDMVKKLEMSYADQARLQACCREQGIEFLSSAFDMDSLDFLNELAISRLKIPSGEITNAPYLVKAARFHKPILLSTGMCEISDIRIALGAIAFGYLGYDTTPSLDAFERAYQEGHATLQTHVTLLHCVTDYPCHFDDINLRAMHHMRTEFELPTGYSDHSPGISAPLAAVALGATVIEKHFTLDKTLEGPDHLASLDPTELAQMCQGIREVERSLGDGFKQCTAREQKNRDIARKSLVAATPMKRGEVFTADNITIKRPGNGISPIDYWNTLGTTAMKDYHPDDLI